MKSILKFILCLLSVIFLSNGVCLAQELDKAFKKISQLEGFQLLPYTAEEYGFPKELGDMKMVGYGNSEPRDKVLEILETIPQHLLKIDEWDERKKINRVYLEKGKKRKAYLMRVFIGQGGNDLAVWIFTGASYEYYQKIIQQVRDELSK